MTDKVKNANKPCARCGENPRIIVTRRATGEKYAWSLCSECEKARKAGKGKKSAKKAAAKAAEPRKAEPNTLVLENEIQVYLFKNHLVGQMSDGYWENTRPHDHWKPWANANVIFTDGELPVGRNFYAQKTAYAFSKLIEYVGHEMLEELEHDLGVKLTETELRKELNRINKVIKITT